MKFMFIFNIEESDFNETQDRGLDDPTDIHYAIATCCILTLCFFGLLGNGIAFWFLSFRIPRNKFTVYIINLMIADFLYLLFNSILLILQFDLLIGLHPFIPGIPHITIVLEILYDGAYQAGIFFLLAISVERCLSVFYPIWYRCCRPKHQSSTVCLSMWLIASLQSCLENLICSPKAFTSKSVMCTGTQAMTFALSMGVSLPVMLLSSTILLIKVQKTSMTCRAPKLYIIIIISVFVFLVASVPVKFLWLFLYLNILPNDFHTVNFFYISILCTVFSSSINPYIYFMIGKQKKRKIKGSIHSALQNVFHLDEDETERTFGQGSGISYIS